MDVHLRPAVAADAEIFASWEDDDAFCSRAGWRPRGPRDAAVEWWRSTLGSPKPDSLRLIAIEDSTVVGYADLNGTGPMERELGYVVGPSSAWGRGLGTKVARAGLAYAFEELRVQRVWAEALAANVASVTILRRIGMTETGLGGEDDFLGSPSRYIRFEILGNRSLRTATPSAT